MAERDEEMIRGTVQSIVFQNAENGYTVLRLRTEGGDQITVTGTIPMTLVGERLVIAGKWGRHPSHGPQFEAEFLERLMPETTQEIFSYLSSDRREDCGTIWCTEPRCAGKRAVAPCGDPRHHAL